MFCLDTARRTATVYAYRTGIPHRVLFYDYGNGRGTYDVRPSHRPPAEGWVVVR